MRGTYNDYGSIEKVDDHPLQEALFDEIEQYRIPFDSVNEFLQSITDLKERRGDSDWDMTKKEHRELFTAINQKMAFAIERNGRYTSLDQLADDMERQMIGDNKIKSYDSFVGEFKSFGFCMVLESVWDEVRDMYLNDNEMNWYQHPHKHIDDQVKIFNSKDDDMDDADEKANSIVLKYAIGALNHSLKTYDNFSETLKFNQKMYEAGLLGSYVDMVKEVTDFNNVVNVMRKSLHGDPQAGSQMDNHKFMTKSYGIFSKCAEINEED